MDGDLLLCKVTAHTREKLHASPDEVLNQAQATELSELLARRLRGEPMAYLFGEKEFYSLMFEVTPATLIPRPATETLVDVALECIGQCPDVSILELGSGCGAVAVALSVTLQRQGVTHRLCAVDSSQAALEIARGNARRHQVTSQTNHIEFLQSDWFANLGNRTFDLIVSNPPYVADDDPDLDAEVKAHEPHDALLAGPRGDECLERIISSAAQYLNPGAHLVVEHGARQAACVADLMRAHQFKTPTCVNDIEGHPRVSFARAP